MWAFQGELIQRQSDKREGEAQGGPEAKVVEGPNPKASGAGQECSTPPVDLGKTVKSRPNLSNSKSFTGFVKLNPESALEPGTLSPLRRRALENEEA